MLDKQNKIKVGFVSKPHGIGGEIVAHVDYGFSTDDLCFDFLLIELDGGLVPFYVEQIRDKNLEESLIKFEFVENQNDAKRISGAQIYIDREWLDNQDNNINGMSVGMLIGFDAFDTKLGQFGKITDIDEQGGTNPLFVIETSNGERLVPIADNLISDINTKQKKITFDLPEGLINI